MKNFSCAILCIYSFTINQPATLSPNLIAVTLHDNLISINIYKSIEDGPCMGRQGQAAAGEGLANQ